MENIVWKPTRQYIEESNIKRFMNKYNIRSYETLLDRSTEDIEWFWDAALKDLGVEWFKPYEKVLDASQGIQWARWFIDGKLNIVHNCLDRHLQLSKSDKVACVWEGDDGQIRELTYGDLYRDVNRLANGLKGLGVRKGDTIGTYMPMIPEVVIVLLSCLKIGAVYVPIFSGFGAQALASRLRDSECKILFTADGSLRRNQKYDIKKQADIAVDGIRSIKKVIVCKRLNIEISWREDRDIWWDDLVMNQPVECPTEWMDSEDLGILIYTSGTSGAPKGCVHTHAGCLAQVCKEVAYYFDVKEKDIFFWLTDIGWMMGPWMIIGGLFLGATILIFEGTPDHPTPGRLWEMIERHRISIFGISPTVIRLLARHGEDWVKNHDLGSLRILGSTGEPWDTDSWMWFFTNTGGGKIPVINISGGTEIIGCLLSPLPITALKPCTLRGPGLGMDVDVFNEEGKSVREGRGHLVVKKPAPSMTKGFWKDPQRYMETYWSKWPNIWYHGDWAIVDEDGFWFLHGRSDDTLKVAGRRVGPGEIEASLIEHHAVFEAAAIGVPDDIKGEEIVCFVILKHGFNPDERLREELKTQVVKVMGKVFKPKELKFVRALPKTRSAKIVRRIIKAKFLGEDTPGDMSSIENPEAVEGISQAI